MKTKLGTFFTPGSQTGPVTEVALGRVVPLQHVAVPALQYPANQQTSQYYYGETFRRVSAPDRSKVIKSIKILQKAGYFRVVHWRSEIHRKTL